MIRRRLVRMAAAMNKRAEKRGARGRVSAEMLYSLGNICAYCGTELEPMHGSYDHRIALERGGSNTIDNLVRCCITCQREKFTKTPEEFLRVRTMVVTCALPGCDKTWHPRYAERQRGVARFCSRSHAAIAGQMMRKGIDV